MLKTVHSDAAPAAIGPYSQAMEANGFLFLAGQTPIDPATKQLVPGEIEDQTHQALRNIQAVLGARGLTFSDIAKTTVFLRDFNHFPRMNAVYAEVFGEHRPARSTVEVARLPMDCLVEIECIAVLR